MSSLATRLGRRTQPPAASRPAASRPAGWRRTSRAIAILLATLFLAFVVILGDIALPEIRFAVQFGVGLLLVGYFWFLARRRRVFPATPLDRPLLAIIASCLLATVTGLDARLSLEWLLPLLPLAVLYYAVVDSVRNGWFDTLYLPAILSLSAVIALIALLALTGVYLGWGPLTPGDGWFQVSDGLARPPLFYRAYLPLTNPNLLAALLVWLLPFTYLGLVSSRTFLGRAVLGLNLGVLALALFATGSRGGLLGGVSGLATVVLLSSGLRPMNRSLSRRVPALLFACAGIFLLGILLILAAGREIALDPVRRELFGQAWAAFRSAPWFGIGLHNFPLFQVRLTAFDPDPGVGIFQTPHSLPLLIAAETGLLGVAVSLYAAVTLVRVSRAQWRQLARRQRLILATALGALAGSLVHGQVDSFLFLPWVLGGFVFLGALIAAPLSRPRYVSQPRFRPLVVTAIVAYVGLLGYFDLSFLWYTKGVIAANRGEVGEATRLLQQVAALDPSYRAAVLELGLISQAIGPTTPSVARQSAQWLAEGVAWLGDPGDYRARLGLARLATGDVAAGQADLVAALATGRVDAGTAWAMAGAMMDLGHLAAAREAAAQAVSAQPSLLRSALWDAVPLDRTDVAARAAEKTPSDHWRLARIAAFQGDRDTAAALYSAAFSSHPAAASFGLGCLALERSETELALQYLTHAQATAPHDPLYTAALGRLLVQQGRAGEGERLLRRSRWLLEVRRGLPEYEWGDLAARSASVQAELDHLATDGAADRPERRTGPSPLGASPDMSLRTILNRVTVARQIPPEAAARTQPSEQPPPIGLVVEECLL